jgi:nitrogenase molybdenum-iron protein beta chain
VVADTTYAVALTKFASQELGWLPELVAITDTVFDDQKSTLRARFAKDLADPDQTVVFETDTSVIKDHLHERWPQTNGSKYARPFSPAFVIGSRLDSEFAESIKAGHLSVSYPISNRFVLNRGYAGYRGALHLVEDIFSVLVAKR